jgi:hypothetical protein
LHPLGQHPSLFVQEKGIFEQVLEEQISVVQILLSLHWEEEVQQLLIVECEHTFPEQISFVQTLLSLHAVA